MEKEIAFDDVVALSVYVQSISKDVLDNAKKFDLMQTCVLALHAGKPVDELYPLLDEIVKKWQGFMNGTISAEELLGADTVAEIKEKYGDVADEGEEGSVMPASKRGVTLH